jgi:hypothetical protein
LVEEEVFAYERDLRYVQATVAQSGGLERYLATVSSAHRQAIQDFYWAHVEPFIRPDGTVDRPQLTREIFVGGFASRYPHYYEAALLVEARAGRVALQPRRNGRWRIAQVLEPSAFLAWLWAS